MGLLPLLSVALLYISHASALYSSSSPVVKLDSTNFASKLKTGVWMVEFYAPWCGHCKNLAPEWEKAAKALSGIVNVGAVDADAERQLGGQYSVQGFPTIKFMYHDGSAIKAVDYNSGRTAKDIIGFAMEKSKALAFKRIGQKPSASGAGSGSSGGGGGSGGSAGGFYSSSSGVVNLSSRNFEGLVMDEDDLWMIEFYAPWCGHCQRLKPEYIDAAKQLEGKVKLGAVNCDEEKALCGEYGIQGFPTLKWFGRNKNRPQDFDGGRTAAGIAEYALQQWAKNAPPPEVRELTSQAVFKQHCTGESEGEGDKGPKQLCFVAFLPSILDSQAAGRNAYIKTLQAVADKYKDRPYSYFWAEGGAQEGLEKNVDVGGFGYPALVAISPKRNVFVPHKGALDMAQLTELVDSIRTGGRGGQPLYGELATVKKTEPWDGKDAKIEEAEEFSLDDIMGDEL